MVDITDQAILHEAFRLAAERQAPAPSAIQLIDLAMAGHHDSNPCFDAEPGSAYASWLYPPSPFADLLRAALAPYIEPGQRASRLAGDDLSPIALRLEWDTAVVEPFAQRYRLWRD